MSCGFAGGLGLVWGGDGFERVVWVQSEGEERCRFAESWVWERIGFAGEVCLVWVLEEGLGLLMRCGLGELGLVRERRGLAWSGFSPRLG